MLPRYAVYGTPNGNTLTPGWQMLSQHWFRCRARRSARRLSTGDAFILDRTDNRRVW